MVRASDVLCGKSGIETPFASPRSGNSYLPASTVTFINNKYFVTGAIKNDGTLGEPAGAAEGTLGYMCSYVSGNNTFSGGEESNYGYSNNILMIGYANQAVTSQDTYPYNNLRLEGYNNKFINPSPYFDYGTYVTGYQNVIGSDTSEYNYGYCSNVQGWGNNLHSNYASTVIGIGNNILAVNTTGGAAIAGPYLFIYGQGNKFIGGSEESFFLGMQNSNSGATGSPVESSVWIGKSNRGGGSTSYQIGRDNYCSGSYTFSLGNDNDNRGNGANGSYIVGKHNVSTATRAYIMGDTNTISTTDTGSINIMLGAYNTATHGAGVMLGRKNSNTSVNSRDSVAIGQFVALRNKNTISMGGGSDVAAVGTGLVGNYQETTAFYMAKTTDATPLEAFLGGGVVADAATARNSIPTDCTATFSYTVTARRTDADGSSAGWHGKGVIRNDGGTTALVGAVTLTEIGKEGFGVTVAPVFTAANDALTLTLTGDTTTIGWHAVVKMNMVVG